MIRRPPGVRFKRPASSRLRGPSSISSDPWGNRIEVVEYEDIQFTKAPNVLRGMGLDHLTKNESANQQLADKGMGGTDPFRSKESRSLIVRAEYPRAAADLSVFKSVFRGEAEVIRRMDEDRC
jgi:hypothetical protein